MLDAAMHPSCSSLNCRHQRTSRKPEDGNFCCMSQVFNYPASITRCSRCPLAYQPAFRIWVPYNGIITYRLRSKRHRLNSLETLFERLKIPPHTPLHKYADVLLHWHARIEILGVTTGLGYIHVQVLQLYLGLHDPEEQLEISSRDWLVHSPVMERLMAQLEPSSSTSAQQNAAATLCHAVQRSDLPLWRWFANPAAVAKVFSLAFSSAVSVEVGSLTSMYSYSSPTLDSS